MLIPFPAVLSANQAAMSLTIELLQVLDVQACCRSSVCWRFGTATMSCRSRRKRALGARQCLPKHLGSTCAGEKLINAPHLAAARHLLISSSEQRTSLGVVSTLVRRV